MTASVVGRREGEPAGEHCESNGRTLAPAGGHRPATRPQAVDHGSVDHSNPLRGLVPRSRRNVRGIELGAGANGTSIPLFAESDHACSRRPPSKEYRTSGLVAWGGTEHLDFTSPSGVAARASGGSAPRSDLCLESSGTVQVEDPPRCGIRAEPHAGRLPGDACARLGEHSSPSHEGPRLAVQDKCPRNQSRRAAAKNGMAPPWFTAPS